MNVEQTIDNLLADYDKALSDNRFEKARQLEIEIESILDSMNGDVVEVRTIQ